MTTPGSKPGDRAAEREAFGAFEDDLRKAERKVAGEIDPGARAVVVAVCVLVALVSVILPHAGAANGLDVLTMSSDSAAEHIALPSKIFLYLLVVFGIGFSMLALVTRRWVIAWISLCGSAVASVAGVLAMWTRNTVGVDSLDMSTPSSAGIGLILGWVTMIVLTFHWARVVWARTSYHLALEDERRQKAAAAEQRGRSLQKVVRGQEGDQETSKDIGVPDDNETPEEK
ncbi:Rv2732c family membrane protein [Gordonia sp. (in: high G+C Gram-positive bacteria)]|uniref:Rv2732c family membrane protein n=1 Tax=Gordonia sp. (in: high G+C Gram-positive bacteria) TaxID=84139 RepID=UPI003F9C7548